MIFLPGRKAVCAGLTIFCVNFVILLVAALVKILKLTFNSPIGLYYCICFASLDVERRIIVPNMEILKQSYQATFNYIPESLIRV